LNPPRDMDGFSLCLYVVLSCVGRGLRDELITRPEESYHMFYDTRETSRRRTWPDPGWSARAKKGSLLKFSALASNV
jgi:hypothetical protein